MRVLFTCQPSTGHLLPLMGLARAAVDGGHAAAVLTHSELAGLTGDVELIPAGPTILEGMAEVERRGFPSPAQPGPGAVEMFAGVTVDLSYDEGLRGARSFAPDLVVSDHFALVGPLIAATLGVPWATHEISGGVPAELDRALRERVTCQYDERAVVQTARVALIDPYPELLRAGDRGWTPATDRIAVRPVAYAGGARQPSLPRTDGRRTVLVTVGTTVRDPDCVNAAVAAVLAADLDAVVTTSADALDPALRCDRVRAVGFVPLAAVLPAVDVVLGVGGTGTVLAALAGGVPLVIRPLQADQPWNAERVSACGLGVTIDDFATQAAPALTAVLADGAMHERLRAAAAEIASIDSPATALERLLSRAADGARGR